MFVKVRTDLDPWVLKDRELTPGKKYRLLGIECGSFRILSDGNDPVLFPPIYFEMIDLEELPKDWFVEGDFLDDGYINPLPLSEPSFYDGFHEGYPERVKQFWKFMKQFE